MYENRRIKDLAVKVDSREPNSTLELVKRFYPNATKEQLSIGDIAINNIAIELKSLEDFVKSIMDKRFRNQLYNLLMNENIDTYYVIYGNWDEINNFSNISINAVLGAIASIQTRYNVKVCILPNKEYAIYISCKIIEKSFDHKDVKPVTYKVQTDNRAVDMLIASANKVGNEDAMRLLNHFGTVKNVVNAEPKALESVHKIGKVKAVRIYETVNYDFKQKKEFENDFDIDFDIKNDKIEDIKEDKTEKKIEKLKPLDVDIFDSEYDGNDALKEILLQAILLYENKKGKGIPLNNLLKGVKKPKEDIKQALNDMEHENSIYQEDNFVYRSY